MSDISKLNQSGPTTDLRQLKRTQSSPELGKPQSESQSVDREGFMKQLRGGTTQGSPLPDLQTERETEKLIDETSPKTLLKRSESMPDLSQVKGEVQTRTPSLTPIAQGIGEIEKFLRKTFFRFDRTIDAKINEAAERIRVQMQTSPDRDDWALKVKTCSPAQLKDELAAMVGGLRSGKYGHEATYQDLSPNKRRLVDAIYRGLLASAIKAEGNLDVPEGETAKVVKPGVRCQVKQEFTLHGNDGQDFTFGRDTNCVLREIGGQKYLQKIAPKVGGAPDDIDAMQVGRTLYPITDLSVLRPSEQTFVKTDRPLFETPISPGDIRQGSIGNCFLIAGIYALAQRDPKALHDMIHDNGDTVTVRFYQKNQQHQYEPVYVTVEKSTLTTGEHAQDVLWVQMIEKAYATHIGSYQAIDSGGHTHNVFETFLGKPTQQEGIVRPYTIQGRLEALPGYDFNDSVKERMKAQKDQFGVSDQQIDQIATLTPDLFNNFQASLRFNLGWNPMPIKDDLDRLEAFIETNCKTENRKKAIESLLGSCKSWERISAKTVQTQEDFETLLNEIQANAHSSPTVIQGQQSFQVSDLVELLKPIKSKLGKEDVVTKESITVEYSQDQNQLYDKLGKDLEQGKMLGCGTRKDIGKSQGQGSSGNESMVDGLAGQHAYAILGVTEDHGRKFVLVANPWGNQFSRDYEVVDGQLKARAFDPKNYPPSTGGGLRVNESWIELREFTTLFEHLYTA